MVGFLSAVMFDLKWASRGCEGVNVFHWPLLRQFLEIDRKAEVNWMINAID
jgi:hypothetical protein